MSEEAATPLLPLTRDQWHGLPDRDRLELVLGRPVALREDPDADRAAGELLRLLTTFGEESGRFWVLDASCGFVIVSEEPPTIRRPRVAVVHMDRLPAEWLPPDHGELALAPDLVVEAVGADDRAEALELRIDQYLEAGVRLVWVVHPLTRSVRVHRLDGSENLLHEGDDLHGEDAVPGFSCPIRPLFEHELAEGPRE